MASKQQDDARKAASTMAKLTVGERKARRLLPPDFFDMLLDQIGGAPAFARQVADLLNHPSTPPTIRQRLITDMLHLMKHIEQKSELPPDLSDTPTEELEAVLLDVMERWNAKKETTAREPGPGAAGRQPGEGLEAAAEGGPAG